MTDDAIDSILALGSYVPRYRLTGETVTEAWGQFQGAGISEKAVPGADEDTLTMAAEAGRHALATVDAEPSAITSLVVATTTPPTEEEPLGPRLASMLGLASSVRTRQLTGSTCAGVDALVTGLDANKGPVLVIATDTPRGAPDDEIDHAAGAGAVAAVLADDGPGTVEATAEHVAPAPGTRFRPAGSDETTGLGVTEYDRDAFVDTVVGAVDALDCDPEQADAVALQAPDGKLPYRAARPLGVETETIQVGTMVHDIGDAGTATPLLGLAGAFAEGHERVLLVGYGSGGSATALAVEGPVPVTQDHREATRISYAEFLRLRGEITAGEPDGGGAYVSVPSWTRTLAQRHRLVAGRCRSCDSLAFPPEGACTDCQSLADYDDVELPGTGTVEATTVIGRGGAPPEFVEQQARSGAYVSAIVALDGPDGDTVSVPAQVVGTENSAVGDRVEATIRRIYTQEAVTRYGVKMRPASR